MNNHIKGIEYEIQTRDYIINSLNKNAYLWEDTPETILINAGIIGSHNINRLIRKDKKENPLMDTGIDIIQVNEDNMISLIQCKNGYKSGITMHDLSGFMCWMTVLDKLNGCVYYTDKISNNLKYLPENKRLEFIKYKYEDKKEKNIKENIIVPFDYQVEAQNKITEYLKNNNRGILNLPCGTGKTYISYLSSQQYKQIIILSPLKQFAKQNLECFIKYGFKGKTLLVDSEGERDVNEIKKFIENNETFIISATFFSVDVLYDVLKYTKDLLIIVDEFHNISKNNVNNEEDNFYKILNENHKILFVSATPRVYEMEDDEDDNYMDLFGEIIYKMDFSKAIENKYICDYKIWLPSIHENNIDLDEELTIYEINDVIKSKCNFLYSCLLNNGSRKIIIYCVDTDEIKQMIQTFNMLNDFYYLEYDIQQITSQYSDIKRTKILKNFSECNKIQLLFSIRILDECIDIPKCDSIYITYPSQSKIRTIQRICRCLRIDKNNKFKIGNIYIWCDEYDKILETLCGIKEYDIFFKDKININEVNFKCKNDKGNIEVDKKCIEKYVLCIKEFKFVSWIDKLEMVKKYINENNKRPSQVDKEKKIKILGNWINTQYHNYKIKKYLMLNEKTYNRWNEFINDNKYKEYFGDNEEKWNNMMKNVIEYINENNKRPSCNDKDNNIKTLGKWVMTQKINFKKKNDIMKNEEIYNKWSIFINNFTYFKSNEDIWNIVLDSVIKYINENNKRPCESEKNIKIKKMALWITNQQINYNNKKNIMKKEEIYNKWTKFINDDKYKEYFESYINIWINMLNNVITYINENNKKPFNNKDIYIKKMSKWIASQHQNYKIKKNIMKNEEIYNKWTEFINDKKYKEYFISNDDLWINNLNKVKKYINENNIRPNSINKNKDTKTMAEWISTQIQNRKNKKKIMKNEEIYNKWTEFINDDKYKKYFK